MYIKQEEVVIYWIPLPAINFNFSQIKNGDHNYKAEEQEEVGIKNINNS